MSDNRSASAAGREPVSEGSFGGEERVTAANFRIREFTRFRILTGGLCAAICYSTFYTYSLTTNYMMVKYRLSSSDVTMISTVGSIISNLAFAFGFLLDYAGPIPVLAISTFLASFGPLLFGLAFADVFQGSMVAFCFFFGMMGLGCAGFDSGSLVVLMSNFPLNRGPLVATIKTLGGLGVSILSAVKLSVLEDDSRYFMFFMCGLMAVLGGTATALIRFPMYHLTPLQQRCIDPTRQRRLRLTERAYMTQRPPMRRFIFTLVMVILLLVYVTTQSLAFAYSTDVKDNQRLGVTIVLMVLVFLTLVSFILPVPGLGSLGFCGSFPLPEVEEDEEAENFRGDELLSLEHEVIPDDVVKVDNDEDNLGDSGSGEAAREASQSHTAPPTPAVAAATQPGERTIEQYPQYQTTFFQSVRRPIIWCFWWNCLVTWGCGAVVSLNSAQIYRALNRNEYDGRTNALYSAMIGIGNALGRLAMGAVETLLVRMDAEKRPALTIMAPLASMSMILGLTIMMALPERNKGIVVGFFFEAAGNGMSWSSTPLIIRSIFAKDIGKHYSFMYLAVLIATICLNRFGFGELYDREAKRQRDSGMFTPSIYPFCSGKKCVLYSLILLLCTNVTALAATVFLHWSYRRFSNNFLRERRAAQQHQDAELELEHLEN